MTGRPGRVETGESQGSPRPARDWARSGRPRVSSDMTRQVDTVRPRDGVHGDLSFLFEGDVGTTGPEVHSNENTNEGVL